MIVVHNATIVVYIKTDKVLRYTLNFDFPMGQYTGILTNTQFHHSNNRDVCIPVYSTYMVLSHAHIRKQKKLVTCDVTYFDLLSHPTPSQNGGTLYQYTVRMYSSTHMRYMSCDYSISSTSWPPSGSSSPLPCTCELEELLGNCRLRVTTAWGS